MGGAYEIAINKKGYIFAANGVGLLRSRDNGETWIELNGGFPDLDPPFFITDLATNPINDNVFAAIEGEGVYLSTDDGETWAQTGLTNPIIQSIVFNSDGDVFAGSGSHFSNIKTEGIFFSTDNGRNWKQINEGLSNSNILVLTVDSSDFIFAGTWGDGVFRSVQSTTQ